MYIYYSLYFSPSYELSYKGGWAPQIRAQGTLAMSGASVACHIWRTY